MKDPFPIQPIPWLQGAIQPVADFFGFASLPLHIHEVLAGCLLYGVIYYPLSPMLSSMFFPRVYPKLPPRRKISWHAHVVSLVQSCLINAVALYVMVFDKERKGMDSEERIWGYTGGSGMVQGLAAGYFLWDLIVTSRNMDVFGLGTLAHAISALAVYSLGFRPFVNYYACNFILWELSTPFLNIHWFLDKLGMTGSPIQLYNGLALISTFFSCRLVYGTYQSYLIFKDIWHAMGGSPTVADPASEDPRASMMRFVSENTTIPTWLAVAYLASNVTLNSLNSYWFYKMIQALYKRFQPPTEISLREEKPQGRSSGLDPHSSNIRSRTGAVVNGEPELDVVI